jgi:hypothetical protein
LSVLLESVPMTDQLAAFTQQLDEVRAQQARLLDQIDSLTKELNRTQAVEQKLVYVVDVIKQVLGGAKVLDVMMDSPRQPSSASSDHQAKDGKTLEQLIAEMFTNEFQGYSSVEVVEYVAKHSDAKKESITSTLSRMVTKKALKRDGKLYFKADESHDSESLLQPSQDGASDDAEAEVNLFQGLDPNTN